MVGSTARGMAEKPLTLHEVSLGLKGEQNKIRKYIAIYGRFDSHPP
jgi:hypothetical protein